MAVTVGAWNGRGYYSLGRASVLLTRHHIAVHFYRADWAPSSLLALFLDERHM